jgi:hypothetical protein
MGGCTSSVCDSWSSSRDGARGVDASSGLGVGSAETVTAFFLLAGRPRFLGGPVYMISVSRSAARSLRESTGAGRRETSSTASSGAT